MLYLTWLNDLRNQAVYRTAQTRKVEQGNIETVDRILVENLHVQYQQMQYLEIFASLKDLNFGFCIEQFQTIGLQNRPGSRTVP